MWVDVVRASIVIAMDLLSQSSHDLEIAGVLV